MSSKCILYNVHCIPFYVLYCPRIKLGAFYVLYIHSYTPTHTHNQNLSPYCYNFAISSLYMSIQRINACLRCNETEMKLREKSISFKCYYIIETHTHAISPKTLSFILRNGISNIFLSFHIPSVLRYCLMNYKLCLLVLNSICCCHVIIPPDM